MQQSLTGKPRLASIIIEQTYYESSLPNQTCLTCRAGKTGAKVNVLLRIQRTVRQGLTSWPDLGFGGLFALVMFRDCLTDELLEVERALFHLRVHLAVDKNARVEVTLCSITQSLVFRHDSLVDLVDQLEVFLA